MNLKMIASTLLVTFLKTTAQDQCPEELSPINHSDLTAQWTTNHTAKEIIISNPPCLDDNGNLITRTCQNNQWQPSQTPECDRTVSTTDQCPELFPLKDPNSCIYVTDARNWTTSDLRSELTKGYRFVPSLKRYDFWVPARRSEPFGQFEYVGPSVNYGEPVHANFSDYREFYSGDCLKYSKSHNRLIPGDCGQDYSFVQELQPDLQLYNCPKNCHSSGLAQYKCYCKLRHCETYATFDSVYQKGRLDLIADAWQGPCRIGERVPNVYSSQGLKAYLEGRVWRYGNFETDCSICETAALDYNEPKLSLKFEERSKRKLCLVVYSPQNILSRESNHFKYIYCFTNAGSELKKKVKIVRVFQFESTESHFEVYRLRLEKYMGVYWCEAFTMTLQTISSNRVVAFSSDRRGNEYSLRLLMERVCQIYSCTNPQFYENIIDNRLKNIFRPHNGEIRVMQIVNFDIDSDTLDIILHVTTKRGRDVISEFYQIERELTQSYVVLHFRSVEYCLPHSTTYNLTWPLTKFGTAVTPDGLCNDDSNSPTSRVCKQDFISGAEWGPIVGDCSSDSQLSHVAQFLKDALRSDTIDHDLILDTITSGANLSSVLEVYYFTRVLYKMADLSLSDLLGLVDKALDSSDSVLEKSQRLLNVTDEILGIVDNFLVTTNFSCEESVVIEKRNLIVHVTNPFYSNVSGLALFRTNTSRFKIKGVERSGFVEDTDLHIALHVPEVVLQQSLNETLDSSTIFIVTIIFLNNALFVDESRPLVSTVSVSITNLESYLKSPIAIVFRSSEVGRCGFWDYGKGLNREQGKWSSLGSSYLGHYHNVSDLHVCSYVHLTHFALLLMRDKILVDEGDGVTTQDTDNIDELGLSLMTAIGALLSVLGIAGIFATALICPKWRRKTGTKILQNLSLSILFEIVGINLAGSRTFKESETSCKLIGTFLHYVVLTTFSWMAIYAFLQYLRFVKVFRTPPTNLVLKSSIVGWVVPLGISLTAGLVSSTSYVSSSYEFCYPRGLDLYLFVLLPIVVIVGSNLIIFCVIMFSVSRSDFSSSRVGQFKLQLHLAILLFFVLGLPWLFGIMAELVNSTTTKIVLFYLFCITGSLQGFVLFVFYVLLNEETRQGWTSFLCQKRL